MDKRLSKSSLLVFVLDMLAMVMIAALFVTYMAGYREMPQAFIVYLFLMTILYFVESAVCALSKLR